MTRPNHKPDHHSPTRFSLQALRCTYPSVGFDHRHLECLNESGGLTDSDWNTRLGYHTHFIRCFLYFREFNWGHRVMNTAPKPQSGRCPIAELDNARGKVHIQMTSANFLDSQVPCSLHTMSLRVGSGSASGIALGHTEQKQTSFKHLPYP